MTDHYSIIFDSDPECSNAKESWNAWLFGFQHALNGRGLKVLPDPPQDQEGDENYKKNQSELKSFLMNSFGLKTIQTYMQVQNDNDTYKTIIDKLTKLYSPDISLHEYTIRFRELRQLPGESVSNFIKRLKSAAIKCNFGNSMDNEIILQLAQHVNPIELRRTIRYNQDLTLKNIMEKAHIFDQNASCSDHHVAAIDHHPKIHHHKRHRHHHFKTHRHNPKICGHCGLNYPHINEKCPAFGNICERCDKINHFSSVCRSKHQSYSYKHYHTNHQRQSPNLYHQINTLNNSIETESDDWENNNYYNTHSPRETCNAIATEHNRQKPPKQISKTKFKSSRKVEENRPTCRPSAIAQKQNYIYSYFHRHPSYSHPHN